MKAVVFRRYGSPDVLELEDVPKPTPRHDEVLIRIHATSINDWDWGALHGTPFVNRVLFGLFAPRKRILGSDIAGRIEAVGANVSRFRAGDEVFGDLSGRWGGFAEYVCAPEKAIAPKSPRMTFAQAAAIPQAGMLALQGLRDFARPRRGQKVLINGGGGGAGTFAIQIAKLDGAEITAVDSAEKLDVMRSLGATRVVDYARHDITTGDERYDVIVDVKTNRSVGDYARILTPDGVFVTLGGSMPRLFEALLLYRRMVHVVRLRPAADLDELTRLFDAGQLVPVIDSTYPLAATADAFRRFGSGRHQGKVVVAID